MLGELGDDTVLGGSGNEDEVSGGLGIDIVNGGPGNDDIVHGDYGYDQMYGGSGSGDIASFATAVAGRARQRRLGLAARPTGRSATATTSSSASRASKARPSGDTLIGDKGDNTIDGGPGNDHICRRRRPATS